MSRGDHDPRAYSPHAFPDCPATGVAIMCRSASETGGPRRCSGDTRATYERASAAVATLEKSEQDLLDQLTTDLNDTAAGGGPGSGAPGSPDPAPSQPVSFVDKTTRVEDIRREIDTALDHLNTGDSWQEFLDHTDKFHHYSLNNQMLVLIQRPDATQVAGFNKWKDLGRSVNKGEKAIWIQAPMIVKKKNDNGEDEPRVIGFKPVPVYDVAQTSGKPLPQPPLVISHEQGQAPARMAEDLAEQIKGHGYTVKFEDLGASQTARNGYTAPDTKIVAINSNRSPAQQALTLAHELAHIELGHTERMHDYSGGQRPTMEVEAESVAYVIGRRYGHQPTKPFTYIDGWARGNKELVRSTANNVCAATNRILSKITTTFAESW